MVMLGRVERRGNQSIVSFPCPGAAVSRDFWKLGKALQFSSAYLGTAF
jgi:hypothetical protein